MKDRTKPNLIKDTVIVLLLGSSLLALPYLKAERHGFSLTEVRANHASSGSSVGLEGRMGMPTNYSEDEDRAKDKAFIRSAFPDIAEWQSETVVGLLDPFTLKNNETGQLSDILGALDSSLGELEEINDISHTGSPASDIVGELDQYEFVADFEKGDAKVELVLSQADSETAIYSLNIETL